MARHADVNADQCHRRIGHISARRLELLTKTNVNGVRFSRGPPPCEVCVIGKSTQQPRLKKFNPGITMPFHLVYVDLMGPISPPAMGCSRYVSNITDEFTKPSTKSSPKSSLCTLDGGAPWVSNPGLSR